MRQPLYRSISGSNDLKFGVFILSVALLLTIWSPLETSHAHPQAQSSEVQTHFVRPGDTYLALAWRYQTDVNSLRMLNPHLNPGQNPTIGGTVSVPLVLERGGISIDPDHSLLETAIRYNQNLWGVAIQNGWEHPYRARLHQPVWIPSSEFEARQLPTGYASLELSHIPGFAGEGIGLRGTTDRPLNPMNLALGTSSGKLFLNPENGHLIGLMSTGAFFYPGAPHLSITNETVSQSPICRRDPARPACRQVALWSMPLKFEDKAWTFNDITLTGEAAQIDAESIAAERARLFQLWEITTPAIQWSTPFVEPVTGYLYYSSFYGARRSYNGGPYSSYHEGLDFAAYRGSEVFAPSEGVVALAESLYVRGGAVIIDHGLGIYTGYYHLDEVLVPAGQPVVTGQLIGKVGTTGLSTGPHLHWDLLVNGEWVDPNAWRERDLACWISDGWGTPCN